MLGHMMAELKRKDFEELREIRRSFGTLAES